MTTTTERVRLNEHTAKNWRNVVENMIDFAARKAFAGCCADYGRRYLYFSEATGDTFGALAVLRGDDPEPEGFELATSAPIMDASLTLQQCRHRIGLVVDRLPVIPNGRPGPTPAPLRTWTQARYPFTPADGVSHDD